MTEVGSRELRNRTRDLIRRVEDGERIVITVDGRPAAVLSPLPGRPRWMSRTEFVPAILPHQADAALGRELRELLPETTDDDEPLS